MNKKYKQKSRHFLNVFIILTLLMGVLGCRMLSRGLDPKKNALTAKKVERDKPNLSETTEADLTVDPDSDDLIEETEDEPAVDGNTNTALTANENTSEANTGETNSNAEKPNTESPNAEQKARSLVGKWQGTIDGNEAIFEFGQSSKQGDKHAGKLDVSTVGEDPLPLMSATYAVLKDNSVELVRDGKTEKIGADVSPDDKTMRFTGVNGKTINLTRVNR